MDERDGSQHGATWVWERLLDGELAIEERFDEGQLRHLVTRPVIVARVQLRRLSPREREVLDRVIDGDPLKVIGCELGISEGTATSYLASIRAKTGFVCRQELVFWASRVLGGAALLTSADGVYTLSAPAGGPVIAGLSAAEHEVVSLAAAGLSNSKIAQRRNVSARTVANQIASAFRKLGVGSRFELGRRMFATRERLVEGPTLAYGP